ncbi:hypothetical protein MBLNU459_g3376t2 [Dothideomycetes sp. NU459]
MGTDAKLYIDYLFTTLISSGSDVRGNGAAEPYHGDETVNLLGRALSKHIEQDGWRKRELKVARWRKEVWSPDTRVFENRLLSRLLLRFPFLVEVWYWALIYWVYQLGRAFTAVTIVQGTVHTARRHALQLIHLEQRLHIFHEGAVQQFFMAYPTLMLWIGRLYSFIHIPATILFLVLLYHHTITSKHKTSSISSGNNRGGAALYASRRRTMATCNLIAFAIFTAWPCMPPRLLSDPAYRGPDAAEAKSYGFVDTVHGGGGDSSGESSVWTQNRFCNQYAAMPSLHFGYSLLVGLTVATIPLGPAARTTESGCAGRGGWRPRMPAWSRRGLVVALGCAYPAVILVAIVATANHFILDAVAGAAVCAVAWRTNAVLLNLLPLEDWFLWALRLHKPELSTGVVVGDC